MGATGGTPFFDGDGTFAPEARDKFADPVSGLVSAGEPAYAANNDFDRMRIAGPVQPDADAVREMVNAALLEDGGREYLVPVQPAAPLSPSAGLNTGFSADPGQQPLGMLPQQRNWPSRPPQLLRRTKQRVAPPLEAEFEEAEDVREAEQDVMPRRTPGTVRRGRPSSTSTGVLLAVVLAVVFAVVAIEMLISLFSGISGLFH